MWQTDIEVLLNALRTECMHTSRDDLLLLSGLAHFAVDEQLQLFDAQRISRRSRARSLGLAAAVRCADLSLQSLVAALQLHECLGNLAIRIRH